MVIPTNPMTTLHLKQSSVSPTLEPSWKTLTDILKWRAANQPTKTAYIYLLDGEVRSDSLTYLELFQRAKKLAQVLTQLDMQDERAMLLFPSGLDFIVAFFGCLLAKTVAVPGYPPKRNRSINRLKTMFEDCTAKVVITTSAVAQNMDSFRDDLEGVSDLPWVTVDDLEVSHGCGDVNFTYDQELPDVFESDLAFLQYTSGSTAAPKGVMVCHSNIMNNEIQIRNCAENNRDTVVVGWLPIFHDLGLIGNVLNPFFVGYLSILMSPNSFLQKPIRWLQAISKYKASTSGGPNFAYQLCVDRISEDECVGLDLSGWNTAFNGAEPVTKQTLKAFSEKFSFIGFKESSFLPCYGMAECTLYSTGHRSPYYVTVDKNLFESNAVKEVLIDEHDQKNLVASGINHEGQLLRIVDPVSKKSCSGTVGEIWLNGPHVASGYWNRPDLNETVFNAFMRDTKEGPFLRTGDMGFLTENKELVVTGRLKDMLIINGRNVYPQDIEVIVGEFEAVNQYSVVSVGIDVNGSQEIAVIAELNRAFLKRIDDQLCSEIVKAVYDAVDITVSKIIFLKPLAMPKTTSGKVQRVLCRHTLESDSFDSVFSWPQVACSDKETLDPVNLSSNSKEELTEIEREMLTVFKSVIQIDDMTIDTNFFEMGGNSVMATQIQYKIEEEFVVQVELSDFFEKPTIRELSVVVENKQTELLESVDAKEMDAMLADVNLSK
jgi:acyl-CoA synthetase (AMP-forming)/AMP-acid ligase II/acyl carrier protein